MSIVYDILRRRNRQMDTPRDRQIALTVFGPIPSAINGVLESADQTQPLITGHLDGRHLTFLAPGTTQGQALLNIWADGYESVTRTLTLPRGDTELESVILQPLPTPLPEPLTIAGKWFELPEGVRWTQVGCSDFRLFARYLAGEDILPILRHRREIGFNTLRVFGTCDFMFRLYPQEHGDYLGRLAAFIDLVGREDLRVEFTVFADARRVMPDLPSQQAHFRAVCDALPGWWHFIELVNENDQTINALQADWFARAESRWACHGSNGADAEPVIPAWDYVAYHNARPADWPRKVGHNAMEWADQFRVPCVTNETTRPNQGRGPVPQDWFDAAASAALLCAGATFHSEAGKQSIELGGDELNCAVAWVAGVHAVPLEYQRGQYTAGHLSTSPLLHRDDWASRTYGRIVGDRACVVVLQRTAAWRLIAVNGWRVDRQTESVVELVR